MLLDPTGFASVSGSVPPIAVSDPMAARLAFAALAALVTGGFAILAGAARREQARLPPTLPGPPGGRPIAPARPTAARGVAGFHDFLKQRDGEPDVRRSTLTRREEFFDALEAAPLRSRHRIDRGAFLQNLARRRPEPGLDDLTLWLLATAKTNQAERFGVGIAELYGRLGNLEDDPVRLHVNLQERYHTRILANVVGLFGLPVPPQPPSFAARLLIRRIALAPERWVLPMVGCSEMIGCSLFRALRDRGVALLADEPEIAERVRLLYDEILADEISHVGHIAARLGPAGRRLMLLLHRTLGRAMARQLPELVALFGRRRLTEIARGFDLAALANEARDRAYVAAFV